MTVLHQKHLVEPVELHHLLLNVPVDELLGKDVDGLQDLLAPSVELGEQSHALVRVVHLPVSSFHGGIEVHL
eukprot:9951546-Prorocentrum_lima.AAC.1